MRTLDQPIRAAGEFGAWLQQLDSPNDNDVPCGTCNACCTAAYFIHITPLDHAARSHIPDALMFPAPGLDQDHKLMGFSEQGHCPMLQQNRCSIYPQRPRACRDYDCRIFAATGLSAGDDNKTDVDARASAWQFEYADDRERRRHEALRAIAQHLLKRPRDERRPSNPTQMALLAIHLLSQLEQSPAFAAWLQQQGPSSVHIPDLEPLIEHALSVVTV